MSIERESGDAGAASEAVWFAMTQTTAGTIEALFEQAEHGNGFEAWRKVSRRCDPTTGKKALGMFKEIIGYPIQVPKGPVHRRLVGLDALDLSLRDED